MPALPSVLAQSRGGIVATPNVQVNNGAIAGGLGKAAGDVEALRVNIQQADEREGRIWATKKSAEIRAGLIQAGTKRETDGEDLSGMGDWYRTAANEAYDTALADAPNGFGQEYLDLAKTDAVSQFGEKGDYKAADYKTALQFDALATTQSTLENLAAQDPGNAEKYAAEMDFALDGVPLPLEERLKFKNASAGIIGSAIASRIESDPYSGLAMAKDFQKRNLIGADMALTLSNRADAGIRSREAEARARASEARAAHAEQVNIALAGADDALAYVAAGNVPTPDIAAKYSPQAILALTGDPKKAKKAADAFARGEGVQEVLNARTPAERAKVIAGWREKAADPENFNFNQDTLRILESGVADLNDKLAKDPGGVAEMSGRVQDAIKSGDGATIVAASYAEQEAQGVPAYARKPLSNAYAAQLADQIGALPPEDQGKAMQELQASYGSAFPDVLQQMGTKLPAGLAVAAVMPRNPDGTANRAATTLASVASLKIDDLTTGLEKGAKGDAEEAILDDERMQSLNRMLRSQDGGPDTFAQYHDSVLRLTLTYMGNGMDKDDAAAKAAQEVTADTDFREVDNSMVGIPASANPDMVEAGMRAAVGRLDVAKLDLPTSVSGMADADARAALASNIQRNAEWVPDGKGKGLYLRVIGEPVTIGGQPVFYSWDDLKAAALPQDGLMFEAGR